MWYSEEFIYFMHPLTWKCSLSQGIMSHPHSTSCTGGHENGVLSKRHALACGGMQLCACLSEQSFAVYWSISVLLICIRIKFRVFGLTQAGEPFLPACWSVTVYQPGRVLKGFCVCLGIQLISPRPHDISLRTYQNQALHVVENPA